LDRRPPPQLPDAASVSEVAEPFGETLDAMSEWIRRFIVFPPERSRQQADCMALWAAHTHAFEAADVTPYIDVYSAVAGEGKSTLLEVMELLVWSPVKASSVTPAAIYRALAGHKPHTLLIDEVDQQSWNATLRQVLNAGYKRRGGYVIRVVKGEAVAFPVFSPKMLAGIGSEKLPGPTRDRCIPLVMRKRIVGEEKMEHFDPARVETEALLFFANCERFAQVCHDDLRFAWPKAVPGIGDRAN
jgi:hypothetical protein